MTVASGSSYSRSMFLTTVSDTWNKGVGSIQTMVQPMPVTQSSPTTFDNRNPTSDENRENGGREVVCGFTADGRVEEKPNKLSRTRSRFRSFSRKKNGWPTPKNIPMWSSSRKIQDKSPKVEEKNKSFFSRGHRQEIAPSKAKYATTLKQASTSQIARAPSTRRSRGEASPIAKVSSMRRSRSVSKREEPGQSPGMHRYTRRQRSKSAKKQALIRRPRSKSVDIRKKIQATANQRTKSSQRQDRKKRKKNRGKQRGAKKGETEPHATSDQDLDEGIELLAVSSKGGLHPDGILIMKAGESIASSYFLSWGAIREEPKPVPEEEVKSMKSSPGIVAKKAQSKTESEPADSHVLPHIITGCFQSLGQATSCVFNNRGEECDPSSVPEEEVKSMKASPGIVAKRAESKTESEPADSHVIPHTSSGCFQSLGQATSCVFNNHGEECDPSSSQGDQAEKENLLGLKNEGEIDKHLNTTEKESLRQDAKRNATPKDEQKEPTDEDVAAKRREIEKHEAIFVKVFDEDTASLSDSSEIIAAVDTAISRIKKRARQLGISERELLRAVSTGKTKCRNLESPYRHSTSSRSDDESSIGSTFADESTTDGTQASIQHQSSGALRCECWQDAYTEDEYTMQKVYSEGASEYSDTYSTSLGSQESF